ncbi:MAG: GNAT family N-acetyltransferase, partial [Clostridiales bacterium]|nr:GNAT family N-acetyltransferase [Clostridiales bacterium]
MIFRKITESERRAASSIQSMAFHSPLNPERKKPIETCRAAFTDQGHMTACLELIDYDVWFDGQTVSMGGIGSVASLPEYRRGGHVRGLFNLVFEEMRDRGDVFSWLFPFSYDYYRKFGYEVGCRARQMTIPLADLLPLAQPGRAEQFLPGGDPEPIITVYNDFACRYNMLADRTGCQWQTRLEINPDEKLVFSYVWYDAQDRPAAYFQYRFNEKSPGPRTMEVTD